MKNNKRILFYALSGILMLTITTARAQEDQKLILQLGPHWDAIASQTLLMAPGINIGLGYYNRLRYYISGNIDFTKGKNYYDNYERDVNFDRVSVGVKMKWQIAGNNRYITDQYFHNMRLCLDLGGYFHVAKTELYRFDKLSKQSTIQYLSGDLGFSLMIPYGYLAKHRHKLLNRSDLFLEVLGSYIVHNDVSLLYSSSSVLNNGTPAGRIMLNWTYYFRLS